MDTLLRKPWTTESFLAWEDRQQGRHEFDGEQVVDMTGGSLAHQLIVFNLLAVLRANLPAHLMAVHEMRLRVGTKVRYPDVCVFAAPLLLTTRTLTDALAIFEVLSEDTEGTDRAVKLDEYAGVPRIGYYVLVEQGDVGATLHRRAGGGWDTTQVAGGMLRLDGIAEISLEAIYAGLRLAP